MVCTHHRTNSEEQPKTIEILYTCEIPGLVIIVKSRSHVSNPNRNDIQDGSTLVRLATFLYKVRSENVFCVQNRTHMAHTCSVFMLCKYKNVYLNVKYSAGVS